MAPTATLAPASSPSVPDGSAGNRGAEDLPLVLAARAGDAGAFGELFGRWADRVHDLAVRIVRDPDVAADVTQDAFEVAWRRLASLEEPLAFGGWLLRIARNRALDRLAGDGRTVLVAGAGPAVEQAVPDLAPAAVEGAEAAALLWAASAALAPRDASLLHLHLRHGLGAGEIAAELGVTPGAAHQMLHRLRVRLREAVRATVLWDGGTPACALLRAELRAEGATRLDGATAALIGDHADRCDACAERRRTRLAPEALFAAAPLLVLPTVARGRISEALAGAGGAGGASGPGPIVDTLSSAAGGPTTPAPGTGPTSVARGTHPTPGAPSSTPSTGARRCRRIATALGSGAAAVAVLVALLVLVGPGGGDPTAVATDPTEASAVDPSRDTEPGGARSGAPPSSAPVVPGEDATTAAAAPAPAGEVTPSAVVEDPPATTAPPEGGAPDPSIAPVEPAAPDAPPPTGAGSLGESGGSPSPPAAPPSAPSVELPPATPPPPAAPVVVSFTVTRTPRPGCATPSAAVVLSWRTSGGEVELRGPGAPGGALPASGTAVACSPGPATYAIEVTGPGGVAEQAATVA
jgi:RNA polymerase sigma factor (sigma-70 family)